MANVFYDLRDYGVIQDGSTDQTALLNSVLVNIYNDGGGWMVIPPGNPIVCAGQIIIPNGYTQTTGVNNNPITGGNVTGYYTQPTIGIMGAGSGWASNPSPSAGCGIKSTYGNIAVPTNAWGPYDSAVTQGCVVTGLTTTTVTTSSGKAFIEGSATSVAVSASTYDLSAGGHNTTAGYYFVDITAAGAITLASTSNQTSIPAVTASSLRIAQIQVDASHIIKWIQDVCPTLAAIESRAPGQFMAKDFYIQRGGTPTLDRIALMKFTSTSPNLDNVFFIGSQLSEVYIPSYQHGLVIGGNGSDRGNKGTYYQAENITAGSVFGGYKPTVNNCHFVGLLGPIVCQANANAGTFANNDMWWGNCGDTTHGSFTFDAIWCNPAYGNCLMHNDIELRYLMYGIYYKNNANRNVEVGNAYSDGVRCKLAAATPTAITGASAHSSSSVTVTFAVMDSAPSAGAKVIVSGATPSGYNGTYTIAASPAPTTTSISYAVTVDPGAWSSGGTIANLNPFIQVGNTTRGYVTDFRGQGQSLLLDPGTIGQEMVTTTGNVTGVALPRGPYTGNGVKGSYSITGVTFAVDFTIGNVILIGDGAATQEMRTVASSAGTTITLVDALANDYTAATITGGSSTFAWTLPLTAPPLNAHTTSAWASAHLGATRANTGCIGNVVNTPQFSFPGITRGLSDFITDSTDTNATPLTGQWSSQNKLESNCGPSFYTQPSIYTGGLYASTISPISVGALTFGAPGHGTGNYVWKKADGTTTHMSLDASANLTVLQSLTTQAGTSIFTGTTKIGTSSAANVGFYGTTPTTQQTVTGAKAGNAALGNLMFALNALGIVVDSTT